MNGKLWIALAALLAVLTVAVPEIAVAQDDFSILDDLAMDDLVEVTPAPSRWAFSSSSCCGWGITRSRSVSVRNR